jgi:uncharacterized membrane protein
VGIFGFLFLLIFIVINLPATRDFAAGRALGFLNEDEDGSIDIIFI